MSLTAEVIAAIERRGSGTVDSILPAIPGYSREQVIQALQWARFTGRLECDGQAKRTGPGGRATALPATYRPKVKRRISSVFDLAQL